MIYKRDEYIEESPDDRKFPLRQIEQLQTIDGSSTRFVGHVSLAIQTPMGYSNMPLSFEIEAPSLAEAFKKFPAAAEAEIENAKKELEEQIGEMRRKAASRIITPGELPPGAMPPGGLGGQPGAGGLKGLIRP